MLRISQKLFVVFLIAGYLLPFIPTYAFHFTPKLTEREAVMLAAAAYYGPDASLNMKGFSYEGDDSKVSPGFYAYDLLGPFEGSSDFTAVNPRTGDVWSLWDCKKMSTPQSRRLQAKIKKRFSPEELKSYQQISDLKPECIVE